MATAFVLTATVLTTILTKHSVFGIHECNSLFIHDVFRCNSDKRLCLATKDLVCREPLLSAGIYDQCPDVSNQWRGLCDRICYSGFRMRRGFKCGDGYCETNFMKWCDGKVDCPNDDADEAHCNCTARPSDCIHWASENRRSLVSSQYLFRRVFAPMGFFVIILVIWKYYRTMKLRQRLASLHNHPDVRLCDADVVYVGGVTELARRNNNRNHNNNADLDAENDPVLNFNLPSYAASTNGGSGGGPPPYQNGGGGGGGPAQPLQPPSYQESVDPQQRLASTEGGADDSSDLRVALPPLSPPPIQLNDPNLPPPPPYESVAKINDKDNN